MNQILGMCQLYYVINLLSVYAPYVNAMGAIQYTSPMVWQAPQYYYSNALSSEKKEQNEFNELSVREDNAVFRINDPVHEILVPKVERLSIDARKSREGPMESSESATGSEESAFVENDKMNRNRRNMSLDRRISNTLRDSSPLLSTRSR